MAVRLTLLVRAYCHLCDEMRNALAAIAPSVPVDERDVDADPALEAQWGDKVPVLLGGSRELCHYHLDPGALREFLARDAVANSR
jgi:hypothetical protein